MAGRKPASQELRTLHVVLRNFVEGDLTRKIDEVVDTSHWRNLKALVTQRYLRPFERYEQHVSTEDERMWANEFAANSHLKSIQKETVNANSD